MLVIGAAVLAGACSPTNNDTRSATQGLPDVLQQLTAHVWILDPGDSSPRPARRGPRRLAFSRAPQLSGQGPCNTYHAGFTIDDDTLKVGHDRRDTTRACGDQADRAEQEYLAALRLVRDVDATDRDRLVLTRGSDVRLSYTAQDLTTAIVGDWAIVNMRQGDAITGVEPGTHATIHFEAGGQLTADAGCNKLGSSWELDDSVLTIDPPRQGLEQCEPTSVMDQEAALASALGDAHRVEITDQLTIYDEDDRILVVADRSSGS